VSKGEAASEGKVSLDNTNKRETRGTNAKGEFIQPQKKITRRRGKVQVGIGWSWSRRDGRNQRGKGC